MATAVSLSSSSLNLQPRYRLRSPHSLISFKPHHQPFLTPKRRDSPGSFPKPGHYNFTLPSSTSHSSSSSISSSAFQDSLRSGRFLTNEELEKLQFLENFRYCRKLKSGSLWIRVMRADEMDVTVDLLSESFGESMLLPKGYVSLLSFLVKQYLIERRTLMPHTATLIGFFGGDGEEHVQLAGTVEVCFDKRGANASLPTPTPPKNSPYICNMTVTKPLRRRGIGWHLLKASEELISQMSALREVFLHCRMIDAAPFNMYTKAGYSIVKTDSVLILLTLQRRKHLMCKKLPVLHSPSEMDVIDPPSEELPS